MDPTTNGLDVSVEDFELFDLGRGLADEFEIDIEFIPERIEGVKGVFASERALLRVGVFGGMVDGMLFDKHVTAILPL